MSHGHNESDDVFDRLRGDALRDAADASRSLDEETIDILDLARGEPVTEKVARDRTLGGYIDVHDRPPAFEGSDGEPYTVAIEVELTGETDRPYVAFLVFVRWAATGAGIMGHLESADVAAGASEEEALAGALQLTLHDVKAALDQAIERRREDSAP